MGSLQIEFVLPILIMLAIYQAKKYRQTNDIRHTKSQNLNVSHLVLQLSLPNPWKPGVKSDNKDVIEAAPTGDASTTSEWSTILLPTKVWHILEVLQ